MEEKNLQEIEVNTKAEEPISNVADVTEAELAEVEAPQEVTATEEEPVTEEAVHEEFAEEPINEEPTEETAEEATEAPEEVAAEAPVEELTVEEPTTEGITAEPQAEEKPKREAAGLVIKPWQLAVAAVTVVAMIVGGVVLGIVLGNKNGGSYDDSPVDYEWVLPDGAQTNPDQIILPGYVELTFPAGEQVIEIVLPNPASNPCYFRYTLVLEETGEVLYQSRLIAPGKAVLEIKLSRSLEVGDYSLLIGVDSVSLTDGRTPMNGGEQRVLLKVR